MATHARCGENFNNDYSKFTRESSSDYFKSVKISQNYGREFVVSFLAHPVDGRHFSSEGRRLSWPEWHWLMIGDRSLPEDDFKLLLFNASSDYYRHTVMTENQIYLSLTRFAHVI